MFLPVAKPSAKNVDDEDCDASGGRWKEKMEKQLSSFHCYFFILSGRTPSSPQQPSSSPNTKCWWVGKSKNYPKYLTYYPGVCQLFILYFLYVCFIAQWREKGWGHFSCYRITYSRKQLLSPFLLISTRCLWPSKSSPGLHYSMCVFVRDCCSRVFTSFTNSPWPGGREVSLDELRQTACCCSWT